MKAKTFLMGCLISLVVSGGFCSDIKAQGNLQFNQVLLLSTSTNGNVTLGTVPSNKVWKIEASGTSADGYNNCGFSFDGGTNTAYYVGSAYIYNSSYEHTNSTNVVWLPAGTTITAKTCNYYRWVSIIEFNIVP